LIWVEKFDVEGKGITKNPMRQGSDVVRQLTLLFHIGFKPRFLILISFYFRLCKTECLKKYAHWFSTVRVVLVLQMLQYFTHVIVDFWSWGCKHPCSINCAVIRVFFR